MTDFAEISLEPEVILILDQIAKSENMNYGSCAANRSAAIHFFNNERKLLKAIIHKNDKDLIKIVISLDGGCITEIASDNENVIAAIIDNDLKKIGEFEEADFEKTVTVKDINAYLHNANEEKGG